MQTKRKNIFYLCITVALLVILPLSSRILAPKLETTTDALETSGDSSGGNQPNEVLSIVNASQYNVSEYSLYISNKTGLRVEDENLTMGIPDNWDVTDLTLNVSSVYETMEIFSENGLNGDFTGSFDPWDTYTTYPYQGSDATSYAMFEYLASEERARATYSASILGFPDDYFGAANTSIVDFDKSSANLEIGELIEREKSLAPVDMYDRPLDNEFIDDPKWDELIDPYLGYKASSEVTAEWVAGIDALRNKIDAKWSLLYGYGTPSVAFGTPFYIPFESDSVSITYRWRVINQGYDAPDNMAVLSTINHQLVDGTIGLNGEDYTSDTGGEASLEFDGIKSGYTPDILSHDYYERTFNITDLLGEYGYRKGWHYLDFGVGLFSPDEANDDVTIEWDYISINATHYDWYKAAEFHVDLLWEELQNFKDGNLAFSMYFGEEATGNLMRYFIGYSSQLPIGDDWDEHHFHLPIDIPHLYKNAFEVDDFSFYIGMEYAGPIASGEALLKDAKGRMTVDNLELWVNYDLGPPDALGLEMRLNDGGGWLPVNETNEITTLITDPELNVEFNISGIAEPYIRLYAYILAQKFSENQAIASVSIDRFSDVEAFWNTTYNNAQSFDEANATLANSIFLAYSLRFENLPAFDGLGESSLDWDIYRAERPFRFDASHRAEKSSDDPFLQNVTITYSLWGINSSLLRGEWQIHAHQQNYLTNGTMCLDGGVSSEKFYNNDAAEYQLEFRNTTELYGNYLVALYNSSFNVSANFPKYHSNVDNNESFDWTVLDEGVGTYFLYSLWNDTDGSNQTKRFGWFFDTFAIWRHVDYSITEYPVGRSVTSGGIAEYNIQFNQISVGTTGVESASFDAFNNGTGNPWGVDWPPHTYLLHAVIDNGLGSYTLYLKTVAIPLGSYKVHFSIFAPYHDRVAYTSAPYLNITGTTSSMTITYLSGAFEYDTDKAYLASDNIPYVNDSSNSKIEVSLEETGTPLRDAYISASIFEYNESALMVAIEKYSITFAESDKGIYLLTLDTTSLNFTTSSNYTLIVSYFKSGYYTEVHNVSVQVDAIPLVITPEIIDPNYELEDITIQASSYLNSTGILDPYQDITMYYSIYNSIDDYQYGGSLTHTISNVFEVNIPLIGSQSLSHGDYYAVLNGTGTNLAQALTGNIDFTVYPKYVTILNLTFPTEVRIGSYFSISSKLQYANLTNIANQGIQLTINYSTAYSYQVLVDTDSTGKAVYDIIIPEYYEGNDLIVFAQYFGTEVLNASEFSKSQEILGKIPVNITFTNIPSLLQVGYNATWEAQLSILYEQDYEGKILTLYGFYDFDGTFTQPFLIRELATDNNGTVSYTVDEIDDGYNNMSIYFEFQGDISIEDQYNSTIGDIVPKWNSNFTLLDFPSEIRLGQTIPIELTLTSDDIGFTESFAVMPITIEFDYGTLKQDFLYYTDENGSLYYEIHVPDSGVTSVDYTISFPGNEKIEPFTIGNSTTILAKLPTTIELESPSLLGTQRAGTFAYSATLTDSLGNPVANATVIFVVYDENDDAIRTYSSTTNNEGIAAISITIETTGTFSITAEFVGEGIYAVATSAEATIEVVSNIMYYVRMLPYIGGALAAVVAAGFIYQYAVVVPKRKKRLTSLKQIHQRFSDVENIQYILILTKSGLSIFSRSFTSVPIEETLISGFLTAISSFGAEIGGRIKKGEGTEKGLEQLSYKQFKIIVNDAAIVRTALLLLKDASPTLKDRLRRFNLRFQEQYMDILQNFSGEIPDDGPILRMVEEFMEVDLLYPHNVNTAKLDDFRKTLDKKSINKKILEAGHNAPYRDVFYIRDMMNHLREDGEEEIHIFNGIIELREDQAVFAINPRTRELIDQFKPFIDQLSDDAKKILISIFHGISSETQLRKTKGITDYDQGIATLVQMGMINNDLSITPTGEAVATILRIV